MQWSGDDSRQGKECVSSVQVAKKNGKIREMGEMGEI